MHEKSHNSRSFYFTTFRLVFVSLPAVKGSALNALRLGIIVLLIVVAAVLAASDLPAQRLANNRPSRIPCVGPGHGHAVSSDDEAPDILATSDQAPAPPDGDLSKIEPPAIKQPLIEQIQPGQAQPDGPGPILPGRRFFGGGMELDDCGPLRHRFGDIHLPLPQPMTGASWLNRPLYAEVFSGAIFGNDLIEDDVRHQGDLFSGVRFGWDWTEHLGGETRLGFAQVGTEAIAAGIELADTDIVLWDLDILYYPTGDTRVRPYVSFGLGMAHFEFEDSSGIAHQKELVGFPIGVGLKYRAKPWFAARLDVADNIALPNAGVELQNNFSITLTAEFHFGGERASYWPWNPTLQTW
jgi:hypothetical protein